MSLFRSNTGGLSINTGAANSAAPELTLRAAFGQAYTNRASASAHTPAAGTLFGSSTAAAPAATTPASTAAATTTPPTSTTGAMSLFGNAASKPAGGGLFGSSTAATGTTGAGALFGNAAASQPQQQTATTTAAGGGGGLFGAATTTQQTPASTTGTTGAGGLFGNAAASQPQQQPATTATGGGGLFGAASNQAKPAAGGLFGASTANTSTQQPSATTGGGLFGQSQAQPAQGGLFGQTQTQQPTQQAAPQASVPAVQINYDNLRPRSRFDDLAKPVQDEIALIDKGIARVIKMRDEIGEFMPQHESDIEQLGRDVKFVESKFRTVQVALNRDIQTVKVLQDMTRKNIADAQLSFKATDNLKLPTHYHQTGLFATGQASTGPGASGPRTPGDGSSTSADAQDLITYFNRICDDVEKYKRRLDEYRGDIERDMPGVESGLYEQIRALRERHQGGGAGGNGGDGGMHDQLGQVLQALRETGTAIINQAGQIADTRERVSRLQAGILDSGVYAMGMTG